MTDPTRLIQAARAVIAAEEMEPPDVRMAGAVWLRWEADKLEAKEKALAELKAAIEELDGAE